MRRVWKITSVLRWPKSDHNPHYNYVVPYRRGKVELESSAGTRDSVYAFRESDCLYLLSLNEDLQYIGLDSYILYDHPTDFGNYKAIVSSGDVFLQTDEEIEQVVGKNAFQLKPNTIVRRIIPYMW